MPAPNPSTNSPRGSAGATPARRLALEVTRQVRERSAYAHELIEKQVRSAELPPQERDFAILLILGVAATSGELDFLLNRALTHGSIKADVRDALRVSVYELFFLRKEPHIAVDQGVELVRGLAPQAAGFANKLLREAARLRQTFPFGDPAHSVQALAHQQAFPLWLAERLVAELGYAAAAAFMAASNLPAPLFLADLRQGKVPGRHRLNHCAPSSGQFAPAPSVRTPPVPQVVSSSARTDLGQIDSESGAQAFIGASLEVVPSELPAWLGRVEAGEYIIADASAQRVAELAVPPAPLAARPFLEVGSGRGTKTVLLQHHALRLYGAQMPLYALDLHAFKQGILAQRVERYRLRDVTPVVGDATRLSELVATGALPATFGGALIDAPCSGTGTLRRHPEIRWRLTPTDVTAMAKQALALLKAVARHIEPNGSLTYSTCSALREENEQVVETFLASKEGSSYKAQASESAPCPRAPLTPNSPDTHFAVKLINQP
jgi:16S rRNA (cytosine967-C5)-methyltransferase